MKKLITLSLICLSAFAGFAQTIVPQNAPAPAPEQNFWTPQTLWVLIISVLVTGFIFLIMYALSGAASSLAKEVEKKCNS